MCRRQRRLRPENTAYALADEETIKAALTRDIHLTYCSAYANWRWQFAPTNAKLTPEVSGCSLMLVRGKWEG
jgi:hypothetical protein